MEDGISLYLKNKEVSAFTFVTAAHKLLLLLKEIEMAMSDEDEVKLNWVIGELSSGSAVVGIMDRKISPFSEQVCYTTASGLNFLKDKIERPLYFTNNALKYAKDIVMAVCKEANAFIKAKGQETPITSDIAYHVDKLLTSSEELGSIVGVIKVISIAGSIQCNIYDSVTGFSVPCNLEPEQLATAHTAFGKRSRISGLISFTSDGYPKSIKDISEIYTFPPDDELPKLEDALKLELKFKKIMF